MAYKDPTAKRLAARERQRRFRERQREAKRSATVLSFPVPADPVGELVSWSRDVLKVPPGHPRAGEPMALPEFAVEFIRAGWGAHESALTVGRKNAKSAICAVLALGFLVGPLRVAGWRGAIASLSKEKADELRSQVEQIAVASGLAGLRFRRSPYPGRVISETGTLEVLSSDRSAGHSSSFDLVIVDETGLMPERSRELLAGLRSSVSAKAGRTLHISVRGDSPLYREILQNPAVVARVYAAPDGSPIDDEKGWHAANPGLSCGIKSLAYMRAEVERIRGAPGDENSFRAYDLNQALDPTREMILSPDDLRACFVEEVPPREGAAYLGFDFGEATSATAAAAIWPASGRVETWMAFGDVPAIAERAKRDDAPYVAMVDRGELKLHTGRVVRPDAFLADVQTDLVGVRVEAAAADGFKDAEVRDFLDRAAVRWPIDFRRVGAGKDGGKDVRAFQRLRDSETDRHAPEPFPCDRDIEIRSPARSEWQPRARQEHVPGADRRAIGGGDCDRGSPSPPSTARGAAGGVTWERHESPSCAVERAPVGAGKARRARRGKLEVLDLRQVRETKSIIFVRFIASRIKIPMTWPGSKRYANRITF